jgi:hypothetical protein
LRRSGVREERSGALAGVDKALRSSPGQPLETATRTELESRLAADFSGVRVRASTPEASALGSPGDSVERAADRVATSHAVAAPSAAPMDLSAVRVHTDPVAASSAEQIGARAYSLGSHVVFAPGQYAPSTSAGRHVLTHELAHVAQQSSGGDGAVVRRFTSFSSDQQTTGQSQGWKHPEGSRLSVSDDGRIAAENNGWGPGLSKRAWSVPEKLPESNKVLADQKSIAQLRQKPGGQSISGKSPLTGETFTLQEIEPDKRVGGGDDGTTGAIAGGLIGEVVGGVGGAVAGFHLGGDTTKGKITGAVVGGVIGAVLGAVGGAFAGSAIEKDSRKLRLASDCGSAAREVMGSGMEGKRDACVIPDGSGGEETLTPRPYHGGNPTTPEEMSEEIFRKEFGAGLSRDELYARYAALSDAEKEAFDRKYGMNKFAVPKVGQGITISTEKDMPGFASSGFTWNFHYAAVVLQSGHDYITLESAAGWGGKQWIFFMYGPETKGQSFHEFQMGTGTHGNKASSMVVKPES